MTVLWWYWAVAGMLFALDAGSCWAANHKWRPGVSALLCLVWPLMLIGLVAFVLGVGRRDD